MESTQDDLLALVAVLERDNLLYCTQWGFRTNEQGVSTARILPAVFFTNDILVRLARLFCPDWTIQFWRSGKASPPLCLYVQQQTFLLGA